MKRSYWLLSAGLLAMAVPAHAQTAGQDSTGQAGVDTESAAAEANAESSEIIITANRRASPLADVPIAVSAVTAETLENTGANDIRALNQVAPSLLVSSTGSEANGSARIRGVGTVGDNPGLESSVAVFIDGVYRSRSGIGLNELGEIERVEVLRGPQGTLFGRNASAGLIHIISKAPSSTFGVNGEITYGNYDYLRLAGSVTGPLTDAIAARLDAVYVTREGFYNDINNKTDVNDRNRYFLRGQLRFEPSDALSFRLIGDYTKRDEKCCAAVYVNRDINPFIGNLNEPANPLLVGGAVNPNGNNIINVLRDLGQPLSAYQNAFSRNIYTTPGRSFAGETEDKGVSLEGNLEFGAATLTSITAYRDYQSDQGSDTDYSAVDILYRAPNGNSGRRFQTFSQELRLQGAAFNDRLDWLVGAYYADEDLTALDNLRFGTQYGRFATCRVISGSALAQFYSPGSAGCLSPTGRAVLSGLVPGVPSPFGPAGPTIVAGIDRLDAINDSGSTIDRYMQNSRNFAFFTHNILHVTDKLDLTVGLRYTNERKRFNATFGNDNVRCQQQQGALLPFRQGGLIPTVDALIGLACQGNSTAELNNVSINDQRSEDEFTGTGVISYKPNEDLLVYGSYSRGYKAGGFNLDRSALKAPIAPFGGQAGAQALVKNLQFDPEINDAFELGLKYSSRLISLNVAVFRQQFQNFQLNTFNGTVFLVQTINGCKTDLNGADRDQSVAPGAPNYNPPAAPGQNPAAASGACAADQVTYGVRSHGIEVESSLRPHRDLAFNMGVTYAQTRYRDNLVGNRNGVPLDPALRMLPGRNLSNAPELVVTSSAAWTPDIGTSGLSGLFYVDTRLTSDYNTGSDLFPQKEQDSYAIVNARIGIRGPQERWSLELWAQNLFDTQYTQVAFNSPFQAGATSAPFIDPQYPGGRQIFSAYLAEPRTFGLTLRGRY